MVEICCNKAQLLYSQLQLCSVFLAIKYVGQTLLISSTVYNIIVNHFFLSFDTLVLIDMSKMESGMLDAI